MDNPLVQLDPGLFVWTIITFLILLTLLSKFAWKPLLNALEILSLRKLSFKSLDKLTTVFGSLFKSIP